LERSHHEDNTRCTHRGLGSSSQTIEQGLHAIHCTCSVAQSEWSVVDTMMALGHTLARSSETNRCFSNAIGKTWKAAARNRHACLKAMWLEENDWLFRRAVEPVVSYRSQRWHWTIDQSERLDGHQIKMYACMPGTRRGDGESAHHSHRLAWKDGVRGGVNDVSIG
jgi:hypothetical protein